MEGADRVGAAADAGDERVRQRAGARPAAGHAPRGRSPPAARAPGTGTGAGRPPSRADNKCRADRPPSRAAPRRWRRAACGRRWSPARPSAPSRRMRPTFGAWRSMSISPMYTVHGRPRRAQAAALATPCWPAPVSATMRACAEALGEQRLADGVVDLVRAGVREVLALQPHLGAPARRQARREGERGGSAHPGLELAA